jgi:hypothetical protein
MARKGMTNRHRRDAARAERAASHHLHERWRMQRANAAQEGMRVVEATDGWNVVGPDGICGGPFAQQTEAFRWLDRNAPARRYGAT